MKRVYKLDYQAAESRGELDKWRKSLQLNRDCRDALVAAMRQGYDGYTASSIDVKPVAEQFGYERILWVLANTINHHKGDGRISRAIIQWAENMGIPDDHNNSYFFMNEHPGLIGILAGMVQKEADAAKKPRLTLYQHSREEAVQRGELDRWQASHDKNKACADALTEAIDNGGYHDLAAAVKPILKEFGFRRVLWVLANTLQISPADGHFSDNLEWAKAVPVPDDEKELRYGFYVRSHAGYVDTAIRAVLRLLQERAADTQQEPSAQTLDGEMEDER